MSPFEQAMSVAVHLPQSERERLAKALGIAIVETSTPPASARVLPLMNLTSRPDPVAWRKAESGHAVLATDQNLRDEDIPAGAPAIAGLWSTRAPQLLGAPEDTPRAANKIELAQIPAGSPVVAHADLCLALACGQEGAVKFFEKPPVEIRLATAGYLHLLGAAQSTHEQTRLRRFVQPFAVLSLGPMASSRAVELMIEYSLQTGLSPLDALIAATALAHEIPLLARSTQAFAGISGLMVCRVS
jgi:predicted nucleic acid-binding protein